jgi:hypothetical protein
MKNPKRKKPVTITGTRRMGFQVNMNPDEVTVVDIAAIRVGMTRAAFMRQAALEKALGSRLELERRFADLAALPVKAQQKAVEEFKVLFDNVMRKARS